MKLISYDVQTALGTFTRIGALVDEKIIDLNNSYTALLADSGEVNSAKRIASGIIPPDMVMFLEGGKASLDAAKQTIEYALHRLQKDPLSLGAHGQRLSFNEKEVVWLAPVPKPHMIRDGILLLDHYKVGMERLFKITGKDQIPEASKTMPIFWKPSRSAVGAHKQDIVWPKYSTKLDYEFELGIYIGKRGKDISVENASEHIAGYTIFNDLGLRDIQPAELTLRMGPAKAKDFATSKIMGPYLVTPDEMGSVENLRLIIRVNHDTWFDGRLGNWAFTFEQFIAYVSRDEFLEVGDFFGSGPPAYSAGFEINKWIKPGDLLECEIEGLGVLSNTIVQQKTTV
jgi:2-keto-4-pentenoate hydratase/2-oxohepta-3-ene-1,7-dioic acid hydratase in catechol pathway